MLDTEPSALLGHSRILIFHTVVCRQTARFSIGESPDCHGIGSTPCGLRCSRTSIINGIKLAGLVRGCEDTCCQIDKDGHEFEHGEMLIDVEPLV